jgi:hypothetical protein
MTTKCGSQVMPVYGQTAGEFKHQSNAKLETRQVFYEYGTDRITDSPSSTYTSQAIILQLLRYITIFSMSRVSKMILHPIHKYIFAYGMNDRNHSTGLVKKKIDCCPSDRYGEGGFAPVFKILLQSKPRQLNFPSIVRVQTEI